jgi:hypothetical protein
VYDKVFRFSQTALQSYMEKARIKEKENQGTKNLGIGSGEGRGQLLMILVREIWLLGVT